MTRPHWIEVARSERGVALPMAMIALALLSVLMTAGVVLSMTEVTISASHALGLQARTQAEAGVERAFWALTKKVIPSPMAGATAAAPYNGSTYVTLGNGGGFFVTVSAGAVVNERTIDAIGWAPTNAASTANKAHRHLRVTSTIFKFDVLPPPAALMVRGDVAAAGALTVTTQNDFSCGQLPAVYSTGSQSLSVNGGAGAQGNPGQMPNVSTSTYDQYTLTDADLDMLKGLAKSSGTYLQGDQTFNASTPLPKNGLVFVDTVGGANIACSGGTCTPASTQIPTVTVGANAQPTGSTAFSGMLIVNGSINFVGGATQINGLVYAQDSLSLSGSLSVSGAVMARNVIDTTAQFTIPNGSSMLIDFNCANLRGAGLVPTSWFAKSGSYRELSD